MTTNLICKECDVTCCKPNDWQRHISTTKHIRALDLAPKIPREFKCESCDYICSKQSMMTRHESTNRHKLRGIDTNNQISPVSGLMSSSTSDVVSSQICAPKNAPKIPRSEYMTIITQLLNQNSELKNFIIEQASEHKKETSEIVNKVIEQANEHKKETLEIVNKVIEQVKPVCNITTNNTSNKAFNINMYLNEQCKDAMNFSDFINGIEVSHEDLENNAQLGFVGGISKILIDNLKLMNKTERPIHCTDVKRETMYIKDDNKWTKEEDDSKLRSAIQEITRKSICSLIGWKRGNPESDDMDSVFSGRCIVIQQQSMAGYNREVYYPKVIHAIAREVLILK
jgi:hypothetical protein